MNNLNLPNLNILGSGPCLPVHFTLESIDILNQCDQVYTIIKEADSEWYRNLIKTPTEILWRLFKDKRPRVDNYNAVTEYIIERCAENKSVAYLTYGNPIFYDSITQSLIDESKRRELNVHVFSGVSFLDSVMATLKKDPSPGLQIYEASAFVENQIVPNLTIPLMLVQIGVFGSIYPDFEYYSDKSKSLSPLRDYLLRFYSPNMIVQFVRTSPVYSVKDHVKSYRLQEIGEVTKDDLVNSTMFISAT